MKNYLDRLKEWFNGRSVFVRRLLTTLFVLTCILLGVASIWTSLYIIFKLFGVLGGVIFTTVALLFFFDMEYRSARHKIIPLRT